ncbi:hypothetical protein O4H49_02500 [Kiloniella laminariae]|uniref:Uncharacterized protein n=1 Tax=Kiloniella laminariae TaxID=454162 RepID=A0ABT4LH13_9PROT|nr:hypothetical protein [Kiloniella laminariae]MCZ4279631.1 hypothetical protein [Kiloniella laminariae]
MTCYDPDASPHGWPQYPQKTRSYPLQNYNFQPSELLVLDLLRGFCRSYADPDSLAWEQVFEQAEQQLGPYDGAWVVSAVGRLIRSIRKARKTPFEFIVSCCPDCRRMICATELNVLWLVQAVRQENMMSMETAAVLVLDNHNTPDLLESVTHLGSVLREVFPDEGRGKSSEEGAGGGHSGFPKYPFTTH